jgi:RNA-splicing ligase RtcB
LGIIPGSMASPGFVVSGKGNPDSLDSASHGAGPRDEPQSREREVQLEGREPFPQANKA